MNSFFNSTTGLWALRQLLQFVGAYMVFKGYTDEAGADQAVDAIFQLAGPASFLIGFAGNVWASFRSKVVVGGQAVGTGTIADKVGTGSAQVVVDAAKEAIARKPTLWERLTQRR